MAKTLSSARFGTFSFDPSVDWFEAETSFAGQSIKLSLSAPNEKAVAPLLTNAEAMAADDANWFARLQDCAAGLVDLSNEWNEDQDDWTGPIDREGFIARIKLESIVFHEDDYFEAYFEDGDLFWGHTIIVSGTMTEGPEEAAIAG
jgi:hypothetical protein